MRPHSKYDALNCLRNLWTSVARNCAARVLASRCRCLRTLCIWAARIRAGRLNCLRSLCFYASRVRALRTTASALLHAKAAAADSTLHLQCHGVDPAFQLPQIHVCIFQLPQKESCTGRPPQVHFCIFRLPRCETASRLPQSRSRLLQLRQSDLHLSAAADPVLYPSAVTERIRIFQLPRIQSSAAE